MSESISGLFNVTNDITPDDIATRHVVRLYASEGYLFETIVPFLSENLAANIPVVVIATSSHQKEFSKRLLQKGFDIDLICRTGKLRMFDARQVLSLFMDGTDINENRAKQELSQILEKPIADSTRCPLQVYGEMVNLLWRDGNPRAALLLEKLWNELQKTYSFSLVCAYAMSNFKEEDSHKYFEHMCEAHSEVGPAESYSMNADTDTKFREIVLLQKRAQELETELQHRKAIEEKLLKSEVALAKSERRFRTLAEATCQIVWQTNAQGKLHELSQSWLDFTGVSIRAWETDETANPVHPDDRSHILATWKAALTQGLAFESEYRLRRRDGVYVPMAVHGVPVFNDDGSICEWVGTLTDISTRYQAEDERTQLLISERSARQEAEAANKAKDEFLAMLGHELRNPLSPIVTALELMKLRGDAKSTPEQKTIERQVHHMIRLVDDLLDVSRITRGKVAIKKRPLALSQVIAKAVEMASPLFDQREHHLFVDIPSVDMLVDGDEVRLAQVFANLLTNAAKYSNTGGNISISAQRENNNIVARIKDDGIGISSELLPRIFDLFVQGPRSSARSEGGLGIGLTLVRSLVSLHGGTVNVHSEGPGKGSEFFVSLPAAIAVELPNHAREEPEIFRALPQEQRRRILLVDDNADAVELLAKLLQSFGHEVTIAADGPEALEVIGHTPIDIAILDIGLPVMDGYELAANIREQLGAATPHLIALTGYGQERDSDRSQKAGFVHHLVKPIDMDKLQQCLKTLTPRLSSGSLQK